MSAGSSSVGLSRQRRVLAALLALSAACCSGKAELGGGGSAGSAGTGAQSGAAGAPISAGGGKAGDAGAANPDSESGAGGAESGGTSGNAASGGASASGGAGTGGGVGTGPAILLGLAPLAVSQDGSVVAGIDPQWGAGRDMRWTAKTGAQHLLTPNNQADDVYINALSADGTVIVGNALPASGYEQAVLWRNGTEATSLGVLHADDRQSGAVAVSADGSVVTGTSSKTFIAATGEAFIWTASGGLEGLGFLPGDTASEPIAISGDGSTVIGTSYNSTNLTERQFRWTKATGMVELPAPANVTLALALKINHEGSVIVGESYVGMFQFPSGISNATERVGVVWAAGGQPQPITGCVGQTMITALNSLGTLTMGTCANAPFIADSKLVVRPLSLPVGAMPPYPGGLSDDGSVIAAYFVDNYYPPEMYLWNAAGTPTAIVSSLSASTGGMLSGLRVAAVSADGSVLVGEGEDDLGGAGWLLPLR